MYCNIFLTIYKNFLEADWSSPECSWSAEFAHEHMQCCQCSHIQSHSELMENANTDETTDTENTVSSDAKGNNHLNMPTFGEEEGVLNVDNSGDLLLHATLVDDYCFCPSELSVFLL